MVNNNIIHFAYFGARYYDSDLSVWLSVDPMSDERLGLSPYNYCQLNPVMLIDPDGALDDEWGLNTETGEMTHMSNLGGDEVQIINHYKNDENGVARLTNTTAIEGPTVYSGPVAQNYENPNFTFGVSNKDLWSDVPDEYLGHYTEWDLKERYSASQNEDQSKIESIKSQEFEGLDRRSMIWNTSDAYRQVVNKYGTDASIIMAYDYGLLPLPSGQIGTLNYSQRSLAINRSIYFKNVSKSKGSNYFEKIAIYSTSSKLSNNSWIRFLQLNKGKYSGSGWLNSARQDYYILKAAGGI